MNRDTKSFILPIIIGGSFLWAASVVGQVLVATRENATGHGWILLIGVGLWACSAVLAYGIADLVSKGFK